MAEKKPLAWELSLEILLALCLRSSLQYVGEPREMTTLAGPSHSPPSSATGILLMMLLAIIASGLPVGIFRIPQPVLLATCAQS
jgi:hypothetical protein